MKYTLSQIFEKPINGEWGVDLTDGKDGVKVIRTTNFTNLGRLDFTDVVQRDIDTQKHKDKALKYGDIIIEKSGGSPTQPVGRVVIFEKIVDEKYFCNNFTSILRPTEVINPKYALFLLRDLYLKKTVLKYQNKTTGIINLKLNDYLKNTEVIVPKLEVQQKIAKVLEKSQELIDKRKAQIEALDELVKSKFIEMFGDPGNNSKNWECNELKNVTLKITDGKHGDCENEEKSGYYFISAKDINDRKINTEYSRQITKADFDETNKRTMLQVGDIAIVNTGATIGKTAIATEDDVLKNLTFQKSVAIVTVDSKKLLSEFLEQYIIFDRERIYNNASGSAQKNWLLSQMRSYKIMLPPVKLQNEFVTFVNQVDKLKFEMEKSLQEMQNNFNSLMQKAFNGELFT